MQQRDKLFINGKWIQPHGSGLIDVVHSATEAVMGKDSRGRRPGRRGRHRRRAGRLRWLVEHAAGRARRLHPRKIAEGLKDRTEELAQLIARRSGHADQAGAGHPGGRAGL